LKPVYLQQEILFLTHYFSNEVETFANLILLDSYFCMRGYRVEVLFNFKRDMLSQEFHRVDSTCGLETKIWVLNNSQKLSVSFLEQKLALLLKDRDVNVAIPEIWIPELNNINGEWQVDNFGKLLNGCLDIIDYTRAEDVKYEVWKSTLALLDRIFLSFVVLFLQKVCLTLMREFNSFFNNFREVDRQVNLHLFKTWVVSLLEVVGHDNRVEQVTSAAEEIADFSHVRHGISSKSVEQSAWTHSFKGLGDALHKVSVLIGVILVDGVDALPLVKSQVWHRVVYANHWNYLQHLVGDKVEERSSAFAPDLLKRDHPDLRSLSIEKRQLVPWVRVFVFFNAYGRVGPLFLSHHLLSIFLRFLKVAELRFLSFLVE